MGSSCCKGPAPLPPEPDTEPQQQQPKVSEVTTVPNDGPPPGGPGPSQMPPPAQPEEPNKPKPQVFAVMRNGHEVIRGMMKDCEMAPDMTAFRRALGILMQWQELHASSEDGTTTCKGFFAVINERFEDLAHSKGLISAHSDLITLEQELNQKAANTATSLAEVLPLYLSWQEANEKHLKEEEAVMMPCIQKMMQSGVNLIEVLQSEVMPTIWDRPDFGFFVQHAASTLEKYPEGQPRARVWLHALMAICSPDRWQRYLPYVKAGLSPRAFQQINAEVHLQWPEMPLHAKPDAAPKASEKAQPMIFAIMRNGHEVIRAFMKDCLIAPDAQVLRERVGVLLAWQELHALAEDGASGARGFFAVIDAECEGRASSSGLQAAHARLEPLEQRLRAAAADPQAELAGVVGVLEEFVAANEEHLLAEEALMMPCVQEMVKKGVPMKEVLQSDILPAIWDREDFGFFVGSAAAILEKYPEGMPRARVFLHAVAACLPPEWFERVLPYIKAALSPSLFKVINAETDMDPASPASFDG